MGAVADMHAVNMRKSGHAARKKEANYGLQSIRRRARRHDRA